VSGNAQSVEREAMGALGVEREENRANGGIKHGREAYQ
jgi:hypothetical protein